MTLHFYITAQHSEKFYHIFLSVFTNVTDSLHSVALIESHSLFDFD